MHFKTSVIAVFAAMLTVTVTAPTPASEIKRSDLAADSSFVYPDKIYPEVEKRSDLAADPSFVYPDKIYPEVEKRSDLAADPSFVYVPNKIYPEDEKRVVAQVEEGKKATPK